MNNVDPIKNKDDICKIKEVLWEKNRRDYLLFVLGINVGLRVSDLLSLRMKDILYKNKVKESTTLIETKTGKRIEIHINNQAKKAIYDYVRQRKFIAYDEFLFKSRKNENRPITRIQAWQVLKDAAKEANVKIEIGTHTLRKTFGYWAYKSGIDIAIIQKMFNHTNFIETLRYIGISSSDMQEAYRMVNL